jgi:glutathione peroxidase
MVYSYSVKKADGSEISLKDFQGKVLLIVNVASECGFTGQYDGLEKLYEKYSSKGFEVIGFPCNQFGGQEPGTDQQIQEFCRTSFGVNFPVMAKIEVNGAGAHPLYQYLKKEAKGILGTEAIKWNFTKFLVDRNGKVVDRFAPNDKPESLIKEIEKLL